MENSKTSAKQRNRNFRLVCVVWALFILLPQFSKAQILPIGPGQPTSPPVIRLYYTNSSGIWIYTTNGDSATILNYINFNGSSGNIAIPSSIPILNSGTSFPHHHNFIPVLNIGNGAFFTSYETNVIIPNTVTNIGDEAFRFTFLTSINIPNSVRSVGAEAFSGCSDLANASIGNGVTYIGNNAFSGCPFLTNVVFGRNISYIGLEAFEGCALKKVAIPNKVTFLGQQVFAACSDLISIQIGRSVTNIGSFAFLLCTCLTNVDLGSHVTIIGNSAFEMCPDLTSIAIPESVTNIGYEAFENCTSLKAINVNLRNTIYASLNGVVFTKDFNTLVDFPDGLSGGYTIPSRVKNIGSGAFEYGALSNVVFPESITTIGTNAFFDCTNLLRVTIPGSVTNIALLAFGDCLSLQSATILNGVSYVGESMFYSCMNLTNVTLPNSIMTIDDGAFYICSRLSNISIPNGTLSIGSGAFTGCGLTNITFGNSITNIGLAAFSGCPFSSIVIPASIENIGAIAFATCPHLRSAYFEGNAPTANWDSFDYDDATIYYLSGTSGWGPTFANMPTALWTSQTPVNAVVPGIQEKQFGFNINWANGQTVVVEASTDMIHWMPIATNVLANGSAYFCDPQWTNYPGRYYRLRSP